MTDAVEEPPDSRSVLRGGIWRAVSTIVPMGSALVLAVVISRLLGPEALGLQSLVAYVQALALNTTVVSLTQAGIQVIAQARGVGDANTAAWLGRWSLRAHAVAGAVITVTFLLVGVARDDEPLLWVVIAVTGLVDALAYGSTARIVAVRGWATVSQRRVVSQLLGPLLGVGAVLLGLGVTGAFLGQAVGSGYLLVSLLLLERGMPRAVRSGPAPPWRPVVRLVAGFVLALLLAQLGQRRVEVLFLEAFGTTVQVAMFSAGYTVVSVAVTAAAALTSAAMPAIAAAHGRRTPAQLTELLGHPVRVLLVVSLVLVAGFLALGPALVLALFGAEFTEAAGLVRLLSLTLVVAPVAGVLSAFWLGTGQVRTVLLATGSGAVVDVGLCLLLVPAFDVRGAVAASLGSQLVYAAVLVVRSWSRFGPAVARPGWVLRAAVCSALAGLAAAAAALALPPVLAVLVGALAFALVLLGAGAVVGLLPRRDSPWLRGLLPARLAPVVDRLSR